MRAVNQNAENAPFYRISWKSSSRNGSARNSQKACLACSATPRMRLWWIRWLKRWWPLALETPGERVGERNGSHHRGDHEPTSVGGILDGQGEPFLLVCNSPSSFLEEAKVGMCVVAVANDVETNQNPEFPTRHNQTPRPLCRAGFIS